MNASLETKDIYLDAHAHGAKDLAGHQWPWVEQTRRRALAQFAEQGFPTTRDEEWRYTNVTPIQRNAFVITSYSIHYTKLYDACASR